MKRHCLAAAIAVLASGGARSETLLLGVNATLSGGGAIWGEGMLGAARAMADRVNEGGGVKIGDKTYTIDLKVYDDRYRPQDAVTAMDRLINDDGVKVVVGPMGSASTVATQARSTEAKVITLTMGFTPKAIGSALPYAFRPTITTTEFTGPQLAWVGAKLSPKRVRALLPNDETGQSVGASQKEAYKAIGVDLQLDFFDRERVDFVPVLTRILSQSDVLEIGGNSPTTAGLIIKQARELGYKGPILVTGGDVTAELVKVSGKQAAEGTYVHLPLDSGYAETAGYIRDFEAKYRKPVNGHNAFSFAGLQMLLEAMKRAGSVSDTTRIAAELEKVSAFPTIVGKAGWTGRERYGIDHQIDVPFYIGQIRDGVAVKVATCSYKSCE
ncbi:ABC transporter substrate-binding protein [Enterovirga rhinocerotis]|uniref:Amino acid/amide ABC transporter substrate-binding protein (HAAT family) n=1 Tax=Enterovirga rhinocerotis TaxID=1339210 RepID=A0A4R7C6N2_9HYPH|nr:ABC transporter substrate-binding protein [Enterovirga rhinocerotis]TDR92895.1 amino acid/amide ABC transporter substrate-binding protein (HAAT family) [Enterovirga rhinocerotis]